MAAVCIGLAVRRRHRAVHADGEFELAYNEAGDMVSNTPSYYEFFSKDARPAQTIIDRYGKLPN